MAKNLPTLKRADENGFAYKGSQRQIQRYVREQPARLNQVIMDGIPSLAVLAPEVTWVSPLRETGYAEYSDREFLENLGLTGQWPVLKQFWPMGGPVWDGLARLTWQGGEGVLLVEAKSYPEECRSACRAGTKSLAIIQSAIRQTQEFFSAVPTQAWLNEYYQLANRLAHLYFLRRSGVKAWLVLLLFTDDWKPTPQALWQSELNTIWNALGLQVKHDWIGQVYMKVLPDLQKRYPVEKTREKSKGERKEKILHR
ncbi:MAG: hypothetical protein HY587_02235 [Candidatus Omnitrophica bacterium]|nr:hypothetical protein [Candidatus Omnitrophota bacterium]